jgi:hypothetical protein
LSFRRKGGGETNGAIKITLWPCSDIIRAGVFDPYERTFPKNGTDKEAQQAFAESRNLEESDRT